MESIRELSVSSARLFCGTNTVVKVKLEITTTTDYYYQI